jgi:Xaa-Pro dipeptidase
MVGADAGAGLTPFDTAKADRLMEQAGIDVLLATSKHNTQYLLGGYRFIFFSAMDAIGHSRYLPVVVYEKGRPDHAAYVANKMEAGEHRSTTRSGRPAFHPAKPGARSMPPTAPSNM